MVQTLVPVAWGAAVTAVVACLSACGATPPGTRPPAVPPGRKPLEVVTTVVPVTLFTRAVAGACARVTPLLPAQSSPHDFQARPADLAALRKARVLVINGLGLEGFVDRLTAAAANPDLRVIDSSQGIPVLQTPLQPPESGQGRGHDHSGHHGHHGHRGVNPHIWLDPQRAMRQVERIRDGLIVADPACSKEYRRHAEVYLGSLRALDQRLAAQLKPFRGKTFVAYHDVAPYFAQRYGLRGVYLVGLPDQNPTPADLLRVSEVVRNSQLKALLSEPQQGPRSFNALARDLGVRVSVFDPMETVSPQDLLDPATYGRVMQHNVEHLVLAFQG